MCNVNDFQGTSDSDRIDAALRHCKNGILVIPKRIPETESERDWWLIDRAIVIPGGVTVLLENCKIKLSDRCRDNFFRSANCGLGITEIAPLSDIHIKGIGNCVLEGADHPRATGDGSKVLANPCPRELADFRKVRPVWADMKQVENRSFWAYHDHSFGADAGKPGESQYGDWRNIGILFANVARFSIENVRIVCSHGWAISMEACSFGRIEEIDFEADMSKWIDGMSQNIENQDGIDLRNGCHDILISDISGTTGDDIVALTAIRNKKLHGCGELRSTHVMHSDWSKRDADISRITIRNVAGYCGSGICAQIRLLPAETVISRVIIENLSDTSPADHHDRASLLLGTGDGEYGKILPGSLRDIVISNVISNSVCPILLDGYLQDSVISNVVSLHPKSALFYVHRKDALVNVQTSNLVSTSDMIFREIC